MIFKIALCILLVAVSLVYWFYLFIIFAMAANPGLNGTLFKLALLPLFVGGPLIAALFYSGRDKEKRRKYFLASSVLLPTFSYLILFFGDIVKHLEEENYQRKTIRNYQNALLNADREPVPAFLRCEEAKTWTGARCEETLKTLTDPQACRELCKRGRESLGETPHSWCGTQYEFLLGITCAKIMAGKVDPKAPTDVCKAAGLMNRPNGEEAFFQGYYYDCLDSLVHVGTKEVGITQQREYLTLGQLLQINTKGLPRNTKVPLPE